MLNKSNKNNSYIRNSTKHTYTHIYIRANVATATNIIIFVYNNSNNKNNCNETTIATIPIATKIIATTISVLVTTSTPKTTTGSQILRQPGQKSPVQSRIASGAKSTGPSKN
uniref:Uncharacterized protein n=1 Tax=Glossina brevipalpis TaxID=37001 RepID=A0A1A9WGC6_9MUSC